MPSLHDPSFRTAVVQRIARLRPDTPHVWGKMTVDQMLWHVGCALDNALGRYPVAPLRVPLPKFLLKFIVLVLPWKKGGTPTAPEFMATGTHDFDRERDRVLRLLDEFATKAPGEPWAGSALLGPLSGDEWSRLQAKHVDHHLKQFGV